MKFLEFDLKKITISIIENPTCFALEKENANWLYHTILYSDVEGTTLRRSKLNFLVCQYPKISVIDWQYVSLS